VVKCHNLLVKQKRFAYIIAENVGNFHEDVTKASGSRAIAWAALSISSSSGFLRPSAKGIANQFTLSHISKTRADENCTDLKLKDLKNALPSL
jgi:hypothetical protein